VPWKLRSGRLDPRLTGEPTAWIIAGNVADRRVADGKLALSIGMTVSFPDR
jgi:hypothetical protein